MADNDTPDFSQTFGPSGDTADFRGIEEGAHQQVERRKSMIDSS